jgi:hypothetical protein
MTKNKAKPTAESALDGATGTGTAVDADREFVRV